MKLGLPIFLQMYYNHYKREFCGAVKEHTRDISELI